MHASLFAGTHLNTLGMNQGWGDLHIQLFMMVFKSSSCDAEKPSPSLKNDQHNNSVYLKVPET